MKTILSTKCLLPNQRELLLNAAVSFVEYDAIVIQAVDFTLPQKVENVIITSQNGAKSLINKLSRSEPVEDEYLNNKTLRQAQDETLRSTLKLFCVGNKTTALLAKNNLKVIITAQNTSELAHFIVENHKNEQFTYFCGKQRRGELPEILKEVSVSCNEVVVYETHLNEQSFDREFNGVLFFSPSGVQAFAKANTISTAFCIGETTASEAQKHIENVVVSNATTIESTIAKAVNYLKIK